jgi:exodeoxyribonuclease V alpha subunit
MAEDGHVYCPYRELVKNGAQMLDVDPQVVREAIRNLAAERRVVVETIGAPPDADSSRFRAVFLAAYHRCEADIAQRLGNLLREAPTFQAVNPERAVRWAQKRLNFTLADKQVAAVRACLMHKAVVITGGPGTGKTTIIRAILEIFTRLAQRVLLAAPTGRAARRMADAAGRSAKTIHRLLEFSFSEGGFQRNGQRPLNAEVLIIDEASMVDTRLMAHLVQAIPDRAALVLVGDVNQLPSVGAGNVLKDIIASGAVTVVELTEIFRQARQSRIVVNAHAVNRGDLSFLDTPLPDGLPADFYFIESDNPERVRDIIIKLTTERIPRRFGFDPFEGIQVLSPMHKGIVGTVALNNALQQALNPGEGGIARGERCYRVNDKVMQIRNNYDKEVFNGDIGRVSRIDAAGRVLWATFDGRELAYESGDLDELVLAYAVSVHKSQGSEYPAVIIPILTQHYVMLQRNLIYTAITRGRELAVLIGSRKALAIGVHNDKPRLRYTRLAERLAAAVVPGVIMPRAE